MKRRAKFWFKNEKQLMKSLGLNPTPGSGNGIIKEDGQNDFIIAQLKSTDKSSVTIRLQDLTSLMYNAAISHKTPLFISQFIGGPILLTMKLEDLDTIHEYITVGKVESRGSSEGVFDKPIEQPKTKKVQAGNIRRLQKAMENERTQRMNESKQRLKERRKHK